MQVQGLKQQIQDFYGQVDDVHNKIVAAKKEMLVIVGGAIIPPEDFSTVFLEQTNLHQLEENFPHEFFKLLDLLFRFNYLDESQVTKDLTEQIFEETMELTDDLDLLIERPQFDNLFRPQQYPFVVDFTKELCSDQTIVNGIKTLLANCAKQAAGGQFANFFQPFVEQIKSITNLKNIRINIPGYDSFPYNNVFLFLSSIANFKEFKEAFAEFTRDENLLERFTELLSKFTNGILEELRKKLGHIEDTQALVRETEPMFDD